MKIYTILESGEQILPGDLLVTDNANQVYFARQLEEKEEKHYRARKAKVIKRGRKKGWGRKQREESDTPLSSAGNKYRCSDEKCGHKFISVMDPGDAICPKCGDSQGIKI